MNELIKVSYEQDRPTVSGRELHEFLEVETRYNDWFKRMCEYGFSKNVDYITLTQKRVTAQGNETTYKDHQLTIDMAKEISMLQRNEKGKVARQYFISLEKAWNSPEMVMSRALRMAENTINTLSLENKRQQQIIGELKPKATYYDVILDNKGLVSVTQISKDYGMSANAMNKLLHDLGVQYKQSNQWLLYAKYHDKGYTHSQTVSIKRKDGTPDVKMQTKWTQKGRLFLYDLLKSHGFLPTIERTKSA